MFNSVRRDRTVHVVLSYGLINLLNTGDIVREISNELINENNIHIPVDMIVNIYLL